MEQGARRRRQKGRVRPQMIRFVPMLDFSEERVCQEWLQSIGFLVPGGADEGAWAEIKKNWREFLAVTKEPRPGRGDDSTRRRRLHHQRRAVQRDVALQLEFLEALAARFPQEARRRLGAYWWSFDDISEDEAAELMASEEAGLFVPFESLPAPCERGQRRLFHVVWADMLAFVAYCACEKGAGAGDAFVALQDMSLQLGRRVRKRLRTMWHEAGRAADAEATAEAERARGDGDATDARDGMDAMDAEHAVGDVDAANATKAAAAGSDIQTDQRDETGDRGGTTGVPGSEYGKTPPPLDSPAYLLVEKVLRHTGDAERLARKNMLVWWMAVLVRSALDAQNGCAVDGGRLETGLLPLDTIGLLDQVYAIAHYGQAYALAWAYLWFAQNMDRRSFWVKTIQRDLMRAEVDVSGMIGANITQGVKASRLKLEEWTSFMETLNSVGTLWLSGVEPTALSAVADLDQELHISVRHLR